MCGIFGFFDPHRKVDLGTKKMLAYLNHSRGVDGLGLMSLSPDGWYAGKTGDSVIKKLMDDDEMLDLLSSPCVLGHTRRASQIISGKAATVNNAHPFQVGTVTLAHNGYIASHEEIAKELEKYDEYKKIAKSYKVDSNMAAAAVDKWGIDALSKIRGKASLWWVDEENPDDVMLWCWKQDLAVHEADGLVVFSSEPDHLRLCGFNVAGRLIDHTGQLFKINAKTADIIHVGDFKGMEEPEVRTFSYESNAKRHLDCCPESLVTDEQKAAFQAMNGQIVGYCAKCGCYVGFWDIYAQGENKERRLHHASCGSVLFPMQKSECKRLLLGLYLYRMGPQEWDTFYQAYMKEPNNDRQIIMGMKDCSQLKVEVDFCPEKEKNWFDVVWWESIDGEEYDGYYGKDGNREIHEVLKGFSREQKKEMLKKKDQQLALDVVDGGFSIPDDNEIAKAKHDCGEEVDNWDESDWEMYRSMFPS